MVTMLSMLENLFRHEAWADEQLLSAIAACKAAQDDAEILERLHHTHAVQRAFLHVFQGEQPDPTALERKFDSLDALHASMQRYHHGIGEFVASLSDDALESPITIPWFPNCPMPLAEALTQVVMHSQHHRGQNATRLRNLGGAPPLVDFIVWVSRDRP